MQPYINRPRILVVEDDIVTARAVQHQLRALGYQVAAVVATGEEAVAAVEHAHPDLILMDIVLSGPLDGIEAAGLIQQRVDVPVIYLTAYADDEILQRARDTEPYGYILKPTTGRGLYSAIEIALARHAAEQKLRANERWLLTTLKSIGDGLIAADGEGRVRLMNPTAEALTAWTEDEALDRDSGEVFYLVDAASRERLPGAIAQALETQALVLLGDGALLVARDGHERFVADSAAPIRGDDGELQGAVLVFRDVTERRQAEADLRQANADLSASNGELDAFAHTVAHDLKGPVALIRGYSELLLSDDYPALGAEERESLDEIKHTAVRMHNIIDELLLLSEVRKAEVTVRPLDMGTIVDEALQRLAPVLESKPVQLVLPETWPSARGHSAWVEHVWVNYINNAIKYGGNPPRVEFGAEELPGGMVRFWVRDNGQGLTREQQDRLFAPFTRLNQVRARGHGLGLSIVKRIVEKLGGEVAVESQPGRGSTFSFTLPGAAERL
ncbi:MAG TPA: ATP-binding protein [Anaerolineae bacterium]